MGIEAIVGLLIATVIGLIGVIYGLLRGEDRRLAKNIHNLRNRVNTIVLTLATKGIILPKSKDEQ